MIGVSSVRSDMLVSVGELRSVVQARERVHGQRQVYNPRKRLCTLSKAAAAATGPIPLTHLFIHQPECQSLITDQRLIM